MSHFVKCLGDFYCPICGVLGQLKLRATTPAYPDLKYFYIDHYKNSKGRIMKRIPLRRMNKRYAYSCYLGTIVVQSSHANYFLDYPQPTLFAVALGRHWL